MRDIEDGFTGELMGLGRRPILTAFDMNIGIGNYSSTLDMARNEAADGQWEQTRFFLAAPIALPALLSGGFAVPSGLRYLGGELTAFASAPGAYTTATAARLTPYVDEFAYGLMGMPGGMIFGFGATVGTATVLGRAGDDLLDYGYQYGDDLGRLGLYGRGADDLNIPQLNVYGWADNAGHGYWGEAYSEELLSVAELPNRFSGVQQASAYLKGEGVPRDIRVKILQTFEVDSISLRMAGDQEFGVRYFDNIVAFDDGRFLFETFPATRDSLAIKSSGFNQKTWNDMTYFKQWQIRPGATLIEGRAASQGLGYSGGQVQKYILDPTKDYISP